MVFFFSFLKNSDVFFSSFFCLLFGHFLADLTFQTNSPAQWKRNSMAGLLVHVAIHPLCYFTLLWSYLSHPWVTIGSVGLTGWAVIPILTLLHFAEDWFRVTMVTGGWPDNSLFYLWDQVIHIGLI